MKILLTGGGTGGHIIPLLAVVSEMKIIETERNIKKTEFLFIGPRSDFNKSISDAGIEIKIVYAGKLRRYFSLENFTDIFKTLLGLIQSLYFVYKFKPNIVFSKGGFASIPPVFAAWILKVPVITHESDTIPGLANRMIAKLAKKVLVSFYFSKKYFSEKKVILTGNPIREEILKGDKKKAQELFDLKENMPTILVFGGSQGARKINEVITKSLPQILERFQVIHLCGKSNHKEVEIEVKKMKLKKIYRYRLYPFLSDELKDAFALCDVIVSRAGANSLFEIVALEKPSIIIPLASAASNHQVENAEFFQERKMLSIINEEALNENILAEKLFELFDENNIKNEMIEEMKEYNNFIGQKPIDNIISEILDYCDPITDIKK
ncbi:undecaprenyldiphospho-muramoylpentapeptide beta-N-acetylglucosaminyltransferase [Candidatus Parcubacteria bacterium]|nr:undecaprenyldiphospho-muramoylpentapeptide beta-N-acetylglucosaminyltransferase [Candidatus Parcubacteria bacterium]